MAGIYFLLSYKTQKITRKKVTYPVSFSFARPQTFPLAIGHTCICMGYANPAEQFSVTLVTVYVSTGKLFHGPLHEN